MEKGQFSAKRSILLFAFLGGLAGNATVAALTNQSIPFSIFPLLTFGLALYCAYQAYTSSPLVEGIVSLAVGSFLVGAFGYSSFLKALNPELGSNYFSLMLMLALLFWICIKSGVTSKPSSKGSEPKVTA